MEIPESEMEEIEQAARDAFREHAWSSLESIVREATTKVTTGNPHRSVVAAAMISLAKITYEQGFVHGADFAAAMRESKAGTT